jgi:hypothetical protein
MFFATPGHTRSCLLDSRIRGLNSASNYSETVHPLLFSDLGGASEISARLDPEEWCEPISRFGGFVAKYLADGLIAYFGWPEAPDNDAELGTRALFGPRVRTLAEPFPW